MRSDILYFLNPEWYGCESPVLAKGSTKLANALFGSKESVAMDRTESNELKVVDGVFALDEQVSHLRYCRVFVRRSAPEQIFMVGGTCASEITPISYLNEFYGGDLAVLWFDAHGDLNVPEQSPSGHFHGMVLRSLLGDGPDRLLQQIEPPFLEPKQVFLAGVRDLDGAEQAYIDKVSLSSCEVGSELCDLIKEAGFSHVYVHIDLDILNPADFSDALFAVDGGPTRKELSGCIAQVCRDFEVVGASVVEYCGEQPESCSQILEMLRDSGLSEVFEL